MAAFVSPPLSFRKGEMSRNAAAADGSDQQLRYLQLRLTEEMLEILRRKAFEQRTTRQAVIFDIIKRSLTRELKQNRSPEANE